MYTKIFVFIYLPKDINFMVKLQRIQMRKKQIKRDTVIFYIIRAHLCFML